jgi:hypothetical protein
VFPINPFHIRGNGLLCNDDGFIPIGLMSTSKTIITKEILRELPWIPKQERGDVIGMLGVVNQLGIFAGLFRWMNRDNNLCLEGEDNIIMKVSLFIIGACILHSSTTPLRTTSQHFLP